MLLPDCLTRRVRGFTLVEVVTALAIVGFLFFGCRALLAQLADSGMHFGRFATRADSDANRELALRSGIARAQADPRKGHHFQGVERSAEFDSRCDSSGGWAEPCRIVLMLQSLRGGADSTRVILIAVPELTSLGRDSAQLFECAGNGVLRYYDPLRELWLPTWMDGITAPAAIALIAESDTIVFNIMGH